MKKTLFFAGYPTGELLLFHGTDPTNISSILSKGFSLNANPTGNRKKLAVYGKGCYNKLRLILSIRFLWKFVRIWAKLSDFLKICDKYLFLIFLDKYVVGSKNFRFLFIHRFSYDSELFQVFTVSTVECLNPNVR